MIPLTVLRRLDCVLESTKDKVLAEHKKLKATKKHDKETIEKIINKKFGLTFHNTSKFTFQKMLGDPDGLAKNLNNYIAGFSTRAREIIQKFKFDEEIEKLDEANRLFDVFKKVASQDLHPDKFDNMCMGYLFEDLVRRFNEQANEEAGDHFTPREVIRLMVNILFSGEEQIHKPNKLIKILDPACGTGGILSVSEKTILDQNDKAEVRLYGQEYNPESYAICVSDLMIKGEDVSNIAFGDTLGTGKDVPGRVDGDVIGVDDEISKFYKNEDKYLLNFKNHIKSKVGAGFYPLLDYELVQVDGKKVLWVSSGMANSPCFLEEKEFYVRTGPATDILEGKKQHEYIKERF